MARDGEAACVVDDAARVAARRQVLEIVEELPFDDDPSAFLRVLDELAEAHALEDGE